MRTIVELFSKRVEGRSNCCRCDRDSRRLFGVVSTVNGELILSRRRVLVGLRGIRRRGSVSLSGRLSKVGFSIRVRANAKGACICLHAVCRLGGGCNFGGFIVIIPSIPVHRDILGGLRVARRRFRALCSDVPVGSCMCSHGGVSRLENFTINSGVRILIVGVSSFTGSRGIVGGPGSGLGNLRPVEFVRSISPVIVISRPRGVRSRGQDITVTGLGPLYALHCSTARHRLCGLVCDLGPVGTCSLKLMGRVRISSILSRGSLGKTFISLSSVVASGAGVATGVAVSMGSGDKIEGGSMAIGINSSLCILSGRHRVCHGKCVMRRVSTTGKYISFSGGRALCVNRHGSSVGSSVVGFRVHQAVRRRLHGRLELGRRNVGILSLFFVSGITGCQTCGSTKRVRGKGFAV